MKKSMLLIMLVALVAVVVGSAPAFAAGKGGFKVGLTMSKFTGDDASFTDPDFGSMSPGYRTGFAVGAYSCYELSPTLTFQPEAYYAMRGSKYSVTIEGMDADITFKYDYLEVPMLFKIQPEVSGSAAPFFYAGPQISMKVSAKVGASVEGESADMDVSDGVKTFSFGATAGAGVQIDKITIEGRYTMGLSSIHEGDSVSIGAFTFLLGISY